MTKLERAIEALEALPPERQDEVADIVLELTRALQPDQSILSPDQLEEVRRRQASGFRPGDPSRIYAFLAQLK